MYFTRMNPPKLLFIGGIHGVGKSTYCSNHLTPLGIKCVTASSLIREHKASLINTNKLVKDIDSNQEILLAAIEKEKESEDPLAIDGHFTLLNQESVITSVSVDVFSAISPDKIILLTANPSTILSRIENRDGTEWSLPLIEDFQNNEVAHAHHVAKELDIEIEHIHQE